MRWEEMLLGLFEDLEQQAEGLALTERDVEVAELSRAEYAQVTLEDRMHASTERTVRLDLDGVGAVVGVLVRVGTGWCLVASDGDRAARRAQEWIVRLPAVRRASGLSDRALDEASRPLSARLGLGSALRGVAAERADVRVHLRDGDRLQGLVGRVGADFVEMSLREGDGVWEAGTGPPRQELVPFAALAALQRS